MAMCMERYGQPIPVAKTQTTLADPDKAMLLQIMKNIQARTGIIIPATIDLTFESPGAGANLAFPPIFSQLDQWISTAILVPSLIGGRRRQARGWKLRTLGDPSSARSC
jgi:phage gp29-like protein